MTEEKTYKRLMRSISYKHLMDKILNSEEFDDLTAKDNWEAIDEYKIFQKYIDEYHWEVKDFVKEHLVHGPTIIYADDPIETVRDTCDWLTAQA